jgi:F0F1-type ATP synthase delta subunit
MRHTAKEQSEDISQTTKLLEERVVTREQLQELLRENTVSPERLQELLRENTVSPEQLQNASQAIKLLEERVVTQEQLQNTSRAIKLLEERVVTQEQLQELLRENAVSPEQLQRMLASMESSLLFSLGHYFRNVVDSMRSCIMSPTGAFISALRSAVKRPASKASRSCERFPEDQRATPEQLHALCRPVLHALMDELAKPWTTPLGFAQPPVEALDYDTWLHVRGPLGKSLRRQREADAVLPPGHPQHCAQPKLWANESPMSSGPTGDAAGQRYAWLKSELQRYLPAALREYVKVTVDAQGRLARSASARGTRITLERREVIARLHREAPASQWPTSSSEYNIPSEEMED